MLILKAFLFCIANAKVDLTPLSVSNVFLLVKLCSDSGQSTIFSVHYRRILAKKSSFE